jgi:imidazolonepropionase-like amidohydrolase
MSDTLFTQVDIFDGSGTPPYRGEVLVRGNRIEALGRAPERLPRDGATVIEGAGTTLMPGMVNCHAHPSYCDIGKNFRAIGDMPVEENTLHTMRNVAMMLDRGFTALLSGACAKHRTDIVIRNAIDAGHIRGPRFLACTPEITVSAGLGDIRQMHMHHDLVSVVLDGPDKIRDYCRTMIREGVDSVKLVISGDNFVSGGNGERTVMWEEEVAAAARVVHAHGRRLIAHARTAQAVKMCVRHGITLIYHANFCDEEALDLLEANRDRHFVNPAIGLTCAALYGMADYGLPGTVAESLGFRRELDGAIEVCRALHRRGVRVLPFGDYGFEWNRVGDDARDLELFVDLMGFSPAEVLTMATKTGGECFGAPIGVIKPGHLADLILVDGNPVQDIRLLQDPARILLVMKDGRIEKDPGPLLATRRRQSAA